MSEIDKQAEPVAFYGLGSQLYGMDGYPVKFPLGTQFYTHPAQPVQPAVAVNEQMLKALKHAAPYVFKFGDAKGKADYSLIVDAIAAAEAAKKGGV